ncbi:MAG: dTMP kinase [Magnetococcales bacterium]|nr:dTMP kinase [Magnetococcales bacterium]
MRPGKFIAFEGIDGAGKSTQLSLLSYKLINKNIPIHVTCEPTNRPIGTMIRQMLSGQMQSHPATLAALFVADRTDHLLNPTEGILAKVHQGTTVLTDRYYFSSYAYQSAHLDMEWVIHINSLCANTLRPDMNIFIDTPPEICFERLIKHRNSLDLYEKIDSLRQARAEYFISFDKMCHLENIKIIDGQRSIDEIANEIWGVMEKIYN